MPETETLPSGTAVKPGDVVKSHFGKTIEIINTDAEGRLILCDALSYVRRFKPAAVIDIATLTGAVVVALGQVAIGEMGNDEPLLAEVREAGERAGERCWPLPLWDEYRDLLKSDIADVKNSGGRGARSEEHTSELQSLAYLVCRLLLEKKKITPNAIHICADILQ